MKDDDKKQLIPQHYNEYGEPISYEEWSRDMDASFGKPKTGNKYRCTIAILLLFLMIYNFAMDGDVFWMCLFGIGAFIAAFW